MSEHKTTDEINAQRDAGWPDFHPEDYCHRCGRPNGNWFIDLGEPEWYAVTGGIGIVCPSCFMAMDGGGLIYELRRWSPNLEDGASDPHLTDGTAELEHRVSDVWGESQFDWTVGRSSEGWFYYCGTMTTPHHPQGTWKHSGHEPTLTRVLLKMIALQHEPSNRLTRPGVCDG